MKEELNKSITLFLSTLILISAAPLFAVGTYHGGSGTSADPYRILTAAHLMQLSTHPEDYDKSFILLADIDMDPDIPGNQTWQKAIIAPNNSNSENFDGFTFSGTFDGNGYSIKNLTFLNPTFSYLGLFGKVDASGTIINLGVENTLIQAWSFDLYNIGFLAGENDGTIMNCHATGRRYIEYEPSHYPTRVGGLVGTNIGSIFECYSGGKIIGGAEAGGLVGWNLNGYIHKSHSTCDLIDCQYKAGGLVGSNENQAVISYSYATGSVQGQWPSGGLAGSSNGFDYQQKTVINRCYATGAVENGYGLVGYAYYYAIIKNSYSIGFADGFVGPIDYSKTDVINCFWDADTSRSNYSGGGTGLTTSQMKQMQTFVNAGWDFDSTWELIEGRTYPYFQWQQDPLQNLCQNSEPFPVGDLNSDCMVNLEDYAMFSSNWLEDIRR